MLPFLHFQMYSQKEKNETTDAYTIVINGDELDPYDFSPQLYDRIIAPVQFYVSQARALTLQNKINKFLERIGFSVIRFQYFSHQEFMFHYKDVLKKLLHKRIETVTVFEHEVSADNFKLLNSKQCL